mgnify:CR=1 FL=1
MTKQSFAALLLASTLLASPALAQDTTDGAAAEATATEATAETSATTAPAEMTPEQIEAQNKAIADFTEAQKLQAAGDHAGTLAKIQGALPTIRMIAERDPSNVQNAGFLASALTMAANSQGALGNIDAIAPLYAEAIPQWRKVYQSDMSQTGVRDTLVSLLINVGNFNLIKENKAAAQPHFQEALDLANAGLETNPGSAELANAKFSALIGLNQSTGDMAYIEQAKPVAEMLRSKGIVNAANEPSVNAILGAA